jgi:hypothetical protein
MKMRIRLAIVAAVMLAAGTVRMNAQASALPSAAAGGDHAGDSGKKLIEEMIAALGGDAWLNRSTYVLYGQTSHFYKGAPDPFVTGFEEYYRVQPFAERVLSISHFSTIPGMPGKDHRDVAAVWTEDNGYEVTFKGKKALPKPEVEEYQSVRRHSLEVVVREWLKQPGVEVTYDGTGMVERRLSDDLTIATVGGDAVVLKLDEGTHRPLSLSWRSRNETYKDYDYERIEFEDYHEFQGVMTPMSVTRYKNDELVSQRFLTKADYTFKADPDFFNPDNRAIPQTKKK